jgi:hypothetical protein
MTRVPQRAAEPLTLDGGKLGKLSFQWQGDRYRHHWQIGDLVILESIEGPPKTAWPDSPPLQQVHLQTFDDGRRVVFGVGMAGRGHWSASFTLVPDLACWIVELACRSPLRPEKLSSQYRLNSLWRLGEPTWQMMAGETSCHLEPIYPSVLSTLSIADALQISPSAISEATPLTIQWAFRLRVK